MSPSSRYTTDRVCASTADASDATKFSPLPMATSNGEPRRAATIVSGSRLETTAIPYVPSTWRSAAAVASTRRSEEHTSELQSLTNLVCRLLLEKKKKQKNKSQKTTTENRRTI